MKGDRLFVSEQDLKGRMPDGEMHGTFQPDDLHGASGNFPPKDNDSFFKNLLDSFGIFDTGKFTLFEKKPQVGVFEALFKIFPSVLSKMPVDIESSLNIPFLYLLDMFATLDIEIGAKKSTGKQRSHQKDDTNFAIDTHATSLGTSEEFVSYTTHGLDSDMLSQLFAQAAYDDRE